MSAEAAALFPRRSAAEEEEEEEVCLVGSSRLLISGEQMEEGPRLAGDQFYPSNNSGGNLGFFLSQLCGVQRRSAAFGGVRRRRGGVTSLGGAAEG